LATPPVGIHGSGCEVTGVETHGNAASPYSNVIGGNVTANCGSVPTALSPIDASARYGA
jgi:hypothetical protein